MSKRMINLTTEEAFSLPPTHEALSWVDMEALGTRSIYTKISDVAKLSKSIPLCKNHNLNWEWDIEAPGPDRRICSKGEKGSHFLPVYKTLFTEIGLRLPLSKFERAVLHHLKIGLSQLHPNAWGFVRSFELVCRAMGFTMTTVKPFFHIFKPFLSRDKNGGLGWLALRSADGNKLFKSYTESMRRFKNNYFFLRPTAAVEASILNKDGDPLFPLYWNSDHFLKESKCYSYSFESLSESEKRTVKGIIDIVKDIPEKRIDCRALLSVRCSQVRTILAKMKKGKNSILVFLKRRKVKISRTMVPPAKISVPSPPRTTEIPPDVLSQTISVDHREVIEVVDDKEAAKEPLAKKAKTVEPEEIMEPVKIEEFMKSSSVMAPLGRMSLPTVKELRENCKKRKRMVDLIGEVPTSDPPTGVSSSPHVQIPGSSQHSTFDGADETWTLFFKEINEKFAELQKKLSESEKNIAHMTSLKDEISKLKKNLEELSLEKSQWIASEKDLMENIAHVTSLKDEVNKLKQDLEELSLEKSQRIAREKDLMEEISKIKSELQTKQNAHKVIVDKLKAEIALQHESGYDKAVKQVISFISGLQR